ALQAGDAATIELLRDVGIAVESAVLAHNGRIVKRLGDGLMATFLIAQEAVDAALEAHDAIGHVQVDGYRPRMRAGIHWGRPRMRRAFASALGATLLLLHVFLQGLLVATPASTPCYVDAREDPAGAGHRRS